jgi:hypothetical protein
MSRAINKSVAVAIVVFVILVLALMLVSTLSLGGYACEVCMEFRGQTRCRTAKGSTEEEARRIAIDNACAFLAGGVTDSIACTNTPPQSVRCEAEK